MARFGPRADGPPIFGPGQAGPIYKRRTGPKWADGPGHGPTQAYHRCINVSKIGFGYGSVPVDSVLTVQSD